MSILFWMKDRSYSRGDSKIGWLQDYSVHPGYKEGNEGRKIGILRDLSPHCEKLERLEDCVGNFH